MVPDRNRYFLGIVPPQPIFEQALGLKGYCRDHFQSKASLNSPPHITLHMPFEWKSEKEVMLASSLKKFASTLSSVKVELRNFGCFAPRVIFIHVQPSTSLTSMQHQLRQFCKKEFGLFNADYKELPFHPHITLAFRDLKKPAFVQAWEVFREKSFEAEFMAKQICLLKHNGSTWEVMGETFVLMGGPVVNQIETLPSAG